MVYHRMVIFSGMMRAKGAIGIEKNSFNALGKEPIYGNFLKPFYLHKGVQPGRAEGQGKEPGGFGPGKALALRRTSAAIWQFLYFAGILHLIKYAGQLFFRKLMRIQEWYQKYISANHAG